MKDKNSIRSSVFKVSAELIGYSEYVPTGKRVATFVVAIPKFIQAHINSHRALSRNSGSSRAMPLKIVRERVLKNPFIPVEFAKNRPGMRGGVLFSDTKQAMLRSLWLGARIIPCFIHWFFEKAGLHKEIANRVIEPWMFVEVIITATEWNNFINLRGDDAAQPEIQIVAKEIKNLLEISKPEKLEVGEWHTPFISVSDKENVSQEDILKISAARCARVSYKLYDGQVSNLEKDKALCDQLISQGHWSPFEHIATPLTDLKNSGNFVGWLQYRKQFDTENGGDYLS